MTPGLVAALIAYLILPVPYAMLAAPLAGLLLVSSPRTARGRIWLAAAALATATSLLAGPPSIATDLVRAGTLLFAGMLVALGVVDRFGTLSRSLLAGWIAFALVVIGAGLAGVQYPVVASAFRAQMLDAVNAVPGMAGLPADQLNTLRRAAEWTARVFPGLALVGATLGGVIASAVAARVSPSARLGEPGPFREFRFNDHLVWGAVATSALALVPLPEAGVTLVANLLVCWGALYAARGCAVLAAVTGHWSTLPRRGLFFALAALLPYSLGATVVMGLADTWIDFRRARTPPPSGGNQS